MQGQKSPSQHRATLNPNLLRSEQDAAPDLGAALRSIADRAYFETDKYQEQQWRAVRDGAHPHILVFEAALVHRLKKLGVPMFANEVWRDAARQKQLYVQGFSMLPSDGPHMSGMAVDIIHSKYGWEISKEAWEIIGHVGKELATQNGLHVQWGGDWTRPWDPAHWEIAEWRTKKDRTKWPIIKSLSQKLRRTVEASPPNLTSIFMFS